MLNAFLKIFSDKEVELAAVQTKLLELILFQNEVNSFSQNSPRIFESENLKGEISIKSWKNNLEEDKRLIE